MTKEKTESVTQSLSHKKMKCHKDLDAWKRAMELVSLVYQCTSSFPKTEMFGLVNQMRRAAVSIPSNIAEGAARQTKKEFIQFLFIALGSSAELETQLLLAKDIGYVNDISIIDIKIKDTGRLINGLIKFLKENSN